MSLILLLIIIVILFGGGFAAYPRAGAYNEGWGFGPFGGLLGLVLLLILLRLAGLI